MQWRSVVCMVVTTSVLLIPLGYVLSQTASTESGIIPWTLFSNIWPFLQFSGTNLFEFLRKRVFLSFLLCWLCLCFGLHRRVTRIKTQIQELEATRSVLIEDQDRRTRIFEEFDAVHKALTEKIGSLKEHFLHLQRIHPEKLVVQPAEVPKPDSNDVSLAEEKKTEAKERVRSSRTPTSD